MAKDYMVQQCKLRRKNTTKVVWIPQKYAVKGKFLRLKEVDGWEVMETFSRFSSSYQSERSTDYRHTRNFSDV